MCLLALPGPSWLYKALPGGQMSARVPVQAVANALPSTVPCCLVTVLARTLSSSSELGRREWPVCTLAFMVNSMAFFMVGLLWVSDSQEIEINLGLIGPFSKTCPQVNSAMNSNNPETPGRRKVTSCLVRLALEDPTVNGSGLAHCPF